MKCVAATAAFIDHEQHCGTGRDVAPATLSAATDLLISDYVTWREARLQVRAAYSTWAHTSVDAKVAFAAYHAALDQEEMAAGEYARRIEDVRRFISPGTDGAPKDGAKLHGR